ncbi:hypothetical protein FCM35_KLT11068 [Carex littledalei]|uniref:Uncharacterized protein n=1 Tax=Carex littledalei TaxID=544730 RepID=A0A833V4C7_9POAL|nr:hypothetical protein FCM35_KLT11068 [Carex littledalei]
MAQVVDLDEWEVLSCNSSCKDEFEEDDFTYLDYFSKDRDLGRRARGFEEKDANFVRGNLSEVLVSSVTGDEHDSIGELGFGEMEVLNDFYLNQNDDGIVDLEGESERIYSENLNSSIFPFQGIDNSDSVFSSESKGEILDWKSPKAILTEARKKNGGFFEMELGLQIKVSNGDCSNSSNDSSLKLDKILTEENITFDENKPESTKEQISKVQEGAKGEVLLAWWKVPIEVIKYCVFGVRPVWSISMAMGFLGFLMFSRSYYLYKMKQKDSKTRLLVKVCFDEKKRAVVQTRAARLNKAVNLVRPDPILRTLHPAFGVTLFPAMSSFQWAP